MHPCNKVSCVVLRKSEVNVLGISVNQHTNEMSAHISLICILQKRKQMLSEVNPLPEVTQLVNSGAQTQTGLSPAFILSVMMSSYALSIQILRESW